MRPELAHYFDQSELIFCKTTQGLKSVPKTGTLKERQMRRLMSIAAAAATIAGGMAIGGSAQAGTVPDANLGVVTNTALPLEEIQFFWGGYNYCWYGNAWNGPGYYWCGYPWRYGYGWGGGYGWNGWRWGGGGAWRGGGWRGGAWHGGGGHWHGGGGGWHGGGGGHHH